MAHLKLRLGLDEHIESGRLIGLKQNIFTYLLIKAQKKRPADGVVLSNAPILASICRKPLRSVQDAFASLQRNKYLYYHDNRGKHGPHPIYLNNFELMFYDKKKNNFISYCTDIWDRNGEFIGDDIFLARIKVRKMRGIFALSPSLTAALSKLENSISADFQRDFQQDFEKMSDVIDKYMEIPELRKVVTDFQLDFQRDFQQALKTPAYVDVDVDKRLKDQGASPGCSEKLSSNVTTLATVLRLKQVYTFSPAVFVSKSIKAAIPEEIINYILEEMIKHNSTIENFWGYGISIMERKYGSFYYAENLKKHLDRKEQERAFAKEIFG